MSDSPVAKKAASSQYSQHARCCLAAAPAAASASALLPFLRRGLKKLRQRAHLTIRQAEALPQARIRRSRAHSPLLHTARTERRGRQQSSLIRSLGWHFPPFLCCLPPHLPSLFSLPLFLHCQRRPPSRKSRRSAKTPTHRREHSLPTSSSGEQQHSRHSRARTCLQTTNSNTREMARMTPRALYNMLLDANARRHAGDPTSLLSSAAVELSSRGPPSQPWLTFLLHSSPPLCLSPLSAMRSVIR